MEKTVKDLFQLLDRKIYNFLQQNKQKLRKKLLNV